MYGIKLWTKTHPGEKLAEKFASSLDVDHVDIGVVNKLGAELGKRIVNMNMMKAYPGDKTSPIYEEQRAAEVLEESQGYRRVIDLHSLPQHGDAVGVISAKRGVSPSVLGFFRSLSMDNLILTSHLSKEVLKRKHIGREYVPRWKPLAPGLHTCWSEVRKAWICLLPWQGERC